MVNCTQRNTVVIMWTVSPWSFFHLSKMQGLELKQHKTMRLIQNISQNYTSFQINLTDSVTNFETAQAVLIHLSMKVWLSVSEKSFNSNDKIWTLKHRISHHKQSQLTFKHHHRLWVFFSLHAWPLYSSSFLHFLNSLRKRTAKTLW